MNILLVAGARPNFMKIAPIYRASLSHDRVRCRIVHTGQHYDHEMSQTFFDELGIPAPHFSLVAGSGSHAVQTARIMVDFEEVCRTAKPDLVMVVGDVNSTLACSVVAKKMQIPVAHVEAGLRSFDMAMPEEINRMVTDAISDYFFVTEKGGVENLAREGKRPDRIHLVGHVMIDNLLFQAEEIAKRPVDSFAGHQLKQSAGPYLYLTLHRPSNVDDRKTFQRIIGAVNELAREKTVFFPVHPRTSLRLAEYGIHFVDGVHLLPPLGFSESLFLWKDAEAVLTDSGGLQEETTCLGIPCVTIRDNTERPITVEVGTNVLAGTTQDSILAAYRESLVKREQARVPDLWDGRTSERIWEILVRDMGARSR
jgi:UDP-N-acetylglucosamine 2-epimerase (non-hydrolysing)